jgi:hypothetical protein
MAELIGRIGSNLTYTEDWAKKEADNLYRYRQQFKSENAGDAVGEVIKWQRADGYAQYMVVSEEPLKLAHVNHGDGYEVEAALIRGINLEEVRQMVDRERALSEMFSKHRASS